MSIRVYELSKILGLSNKELLVYLHNEGFDLPSHASVVPEEAVSLIEKKYAKVVSEETNNEKSDKAKINLENKKNNNSEEAALSENEISLTPMTPADFAVKANKPVNDVILNLLKHGIVAAKNKLLDENAVKKLAQIYELKLIHKQNNLKKSENILEQVSESESKGEWVERIPIIVVLGHVDHGKTTLLDFIRNTKVASKEKGGITQHLGAYEAKTAHGSMIFLDTPGHEAFTMLRARGLKAADIAILVVAADDGIMPQTIEAINQARLVGLPIIVALNKVDKASPNQIESVKNQLAQHNLVPEEWGGNTPCVLISAKTGQGVDSLLDVVSLQSQLMELKANLSIPARGYVLESKFEKGRGPVATIICQHGQLKVGDFFIAGHSSGKVSSIVDSFGKRLDKSKPAIPVQISGFSNLPHPGDIFQVATQTEVKKFISNAKTSDALSDIMSKKNSGEDYINLLVKTDNLSSKEALLNAIYKLSKGSEKPLNVVFSGVGDITESDIILASDTKSVIYGLHVKIQANAYPSIQRYKIDIKIFDIIYKLLESLEEAIEKAKPVKMILKKMGEATVIKVFDIKNIGIIAGAFVKNGKFVKDGKVIILRNNKKIGEGPIKGLQRERKSVKEVHTGYECAFLVEGFSDWQIDDIAECYQEIPA